MPPPMASLTFCGMARSSSVRSPPADSAMNSRPLTKTAVSATCQLTFMPPTTE